MDPKTHHNHFPTQQSQQNVTYRHSTYRTTALQSRLSTVQQEILARVIFRHFLNKLVWQNLKLALAKGRQKVGVAHINLRITNPPTFIWHSYTTTHRCITVCACGGSWTKPWTRSLWTAVFKDAMFHNRLTFLKYRSILH